MSTSVGILISTAGEKGDPGDRGTKWFSGYGPPDLVLGSAEGDFYLDRDTGQVYELSWI